MSDGPPPSAPLFGTDGIRGIAGEDLTAELARSIGRAAGLVLAPNGGSLVIGRDTRVSGPMLEEALVSGLNSAGVDALLAGIIPTPAVAYLTTRVGVRAGGVVSASHNPVEYNGIKFFSSQGTKLEGDLESAIEELIREVSAFPPGDRPVGSSETMTDAAQSYIDHLLGTLDTDLAGMKVVLDCACGAAYYIGPEVFARAGAGVTAINAEPDGSRINVECGSTDLESLRKAVVEKGADIGFAFDGDADRVLAVDETGETVDGDALLGTLALAEREALHADVVVVTVMSNLGFVRALEANGIRVLTAPVGDRFVAELMADSGARVGGEQSGHVILGEHATTGDGALTALHVAQDVVRSGKPASQALHFFEPFPQVLINVPVRSPDQLDNDEVTWNEVHAAEQRLGDEGRILVRASGTEPLVRVMVEASDPGIARATAEALAEVVRDRMGA